MTAALLRPSPTLSVIDGIPKGPITRAADVEYILLARSFGGASAVWGWRISPWTQPSSTEEQALRDEGFVRIGRCWYRRV